MKKIFAVAALAALPALALVAPRAPDVDDLVFEGGRVVDGTGAPWFIGDVAVRGGRIVAVGPLGKRAAKRRIDARGLVVAPGFIDLLGQSEYNVLVDGRAAGIWSHEHRGGAIQVEVEPFQALRPKVRKALLGEVERLAAFLGGSPELSLAA